MQDLAKKKINIKSPAKITLHLEVIGKREDGYHELALIMQNIDLADYLEFEINIFNKTDIVMPINFGLHPYFNVSDFKNLDFIDNPLNCQDQERNTISNTLDELNKINLGVDLLMYTSGRSSFRDKIFKREVTLNHTYPFDLGVIWSDPPRRMICLEPWTSPRNSFVDGFRNIMIPSNDSKRLNASIQIKSLK